jgi:hypothetical protein
MASPDLSEMEKVLLYAIAKENLILKKFDLLTFN